MIKLPAKHSPFYTPGGVEYATFSVGATGNTRTITIQFLDSRGKAIHERVSVEFYLGGDANGDTILPDDTNAIPLVYSAAAGSVIAANGAKYGQIMSDASGLVELTLTDLSETQTTLYLVLVKPDGRLIVSQGFAFTGI